MSRQTLFSVLVSLACLSAPDAGAQASFPAPTKTLYDSPHKEQKSGVQIRDNQIIIQTGVGTPSTVNTVAFSPDSKYLVAGKDFGRIVVWSLTDYSVVHVIDSKQGIVSAVAISPDDSLLASAGSENNSKIVLWDLRSGKRRTEFSVDRPVVQALNFSADGNFLIVRENGAASVIDLRSKQRIELPGERLPVLSLNGAKLLSDNGTSLILRSIGDWQSTNVFALPWKETWPLAIDASQNLIVYGDPTEKESFFAAKLDAPQQVQARGSGLPQFNPSMGFFATILPGKPIVFGHMDGRLWIWNVPTGKICLSPILYSEAGALNSDGKILAGSIDNGIFSSGKTQPGVEIWDVSDLLRSCQLED